MTTIQGIHFDSNKYYTFHNVPQKIHPIPWSLDNNAILTGITNVRGSDESYPEFSNSFREGRAADNSDLDPIHGICPEKNFNNLPCKIIDIEFDYSEVGDVCLELKFLDMDLGMESEHKVVLNSTDYLSYIEEYSFETSHESGT